MNLVKYNECSVSTVDTDGLVLKHQGSSSYSASQVCTHAFLVVYELIEMATSWSHEILWQYKTLYAQNSMTPGSESGLLVHKCFMNSWSKSYEMCYRSHHISNDPIRPQFCTCHDTCAVVTCKLVTWLENYSLSKIGIHFSNIGRMSSWTNCIMSSWKLWSKAELMKTSSVTSSVTCLIIKIAVTRLRQHNYQDPE